MSQIPYILAAIDASYDINGYYMYTTGSGY